ncbi:hypothetical protein [Mycobacterium marinum]|uniref:hypothetical protein n=1 Tax=Mycobacterium marinum TaxID=1781 RepID=UPI0003588AB0|nr:hypothetical protein MMMB2_3917 [Mycobacterium marinum MB2]
MVDPRAATYDDAGPHGRQRRPARHPADLISTSPITGTDHMTKQQNTGWPNVMGATAVLTNIIENEQ